MYVGEGEALLRQAFARARLTAPAVIFIDELDSVAGDLMCRIQDGKVWKTMIRGVTILP